MIEFASPAFDSIHGDLCVRLRAIYVCKQGKKRAVKHLITHKLGARNAQLEMRGLASWLVRRGWKMEQQTAENKENIPA